MDWYFQVASLKDGAAAILPTPEITDEGTLPPCCLFFQVQGLEEWIFLVKASSVGCPRIRSDLWSGVQGLDQDPI